MRMFFSRSFYTMLVHCSSSPVASVDGYYERQKIHLAQNLSAVFLRTFVLEEEGNGFPPNRRSFKSLDSFSRSHPLSWCCCCSFEASCRILVSLKTFFLPIDQLIFHCIVTLSDTFRPHRIFIYIFV